MSKQNYQELIETTEFQRMWSEDYTNEEIYNQFKSDFIYLDEDNKQTCTLTQNDIQLGKNHLDQQMKEHFLAIYNLKSSL